MIKHELRRLSSQHLDGSLMYPGEYVFTWLQIAGVWFLVSIVPSKGTT